MTTMSQYNIISKRNEIRQWHKNTPLFQSKEMQHVSMKKKISAPRTMSQGTAN